MKTLIVLIYVFIFSVINSFSQVTQYEKSDRAKWITSVDSGIVKMMKNFSIPGLSIAIIKDGRINYTKSFGVRNINTIEPVTDNTIFNAASLTKPLFAYLVLKLHDEGKIDIDIPLYKIIPKEIIEKVFIGHSMEKEGFKVDEFKKITPRLVLCHSTGLPMYQATDPLEISFTPGTQFRYSPFSYELLEIAVLGLMGVTLDTFTGTELNDLMKKYVFEPLGMNESSMLWEDKFEKLAVVGHNLFNTTLGEFLKNKKANSTASLYTTTKDYARFMIALMNGEGLKKATSEDMLKPQVDLTEKNNFWGLGVGLEKSDKDLFFYQWGDYGTHKSLMIGTRKSKDGIVFFTNSYYGLCFGDEIAKIVFGEDLTLFKNGVMKNYTGIIKKWAYLFCMEGVEKGLKFYNSERQNNPTPITEIFLIALGDEFLMEKKYQDATKIFILATNDFPNSARAFSKLATAYENTGNKQLAIKNFEKSLQINPSNKTVVDKLKQLKKD